jgi:hypothetical protein
MTLKFWDEAFVAAVHLINRTPSKVLHFTTPLEKLFETKPEYSSLGTFGCACWSNLSQNSVFSLAPFPCIRSPNV